MAGAVPQHKKQRYVVRYDVLVRMFIACTKHRDLEKGSRLHADHVRRPMLLQSRYLASALIDMYAKCGALAKAQEVCNMVPPEKRSVVCWNTLMAGYARHGDGERALRIFEEMQEEDVDPTPATFVSALKACGSLGALKRGKQIHAEIDNIRGMNQVGSVGNALVDMYFKCGALRKAQKLFDRLAVRGLWSWNAIIEGYSQHGQLEEALSCFELMKYEAIPPNKNTFVCILRICGSLGAFDKGQAVHNELTRRLKEDITIGNALVEMYMKCGALGKAQEVFDRLPNQDVITYKALIAGYVEHECGEKALIYFDRMQYNCLSPDLDTLTYILKACGSIGAAEKGEEINSKIVRDGFLEKDYRLDVALMDMYTRCGELEKAKKIFHCLPERDVTSWNLLVSGCVQHGYEDEALNLFKRMHSEGLSPNVVTIIYILISCGSMAALDKGHEMHNDIVKKGLVEEDIKIGIALVDMYARCGALTNAQKMLSEILLKE